MTILTFMQRPGKFQRLGYISMNCKIVNTMIQGTANDDAASICTVGSVKDLIRNEARLIHVIPIMS